MKNSQNKNEKSAIMISGNNIDLIEIETRFHKEVL
jgi:hypothetical protein